MNSFQWAPDVPDEARRQIENLCRKHDISRPKWTCRPEHVDGEIRKLERLRKKLLSGPRALHISGPVWAVFIDTMLRGLRRNDLGIRFFGLPRADAWGRLQLAAPQFYLSAGRLVLARKEIHRHV